jgi:hypothetical protein
MSKFWMSQLLMSTDSTYFLLYMVGSFDHRPHKHSIFAGYVSMSFDILVDSLQNITYTTQFCKIYIKEWTPQL